MRTKNRRLINMAEIVFLIEAATTFTTFPIAILVGLIEFAVIEALSDYASDMVLYGKWSLPEKIKEKINTYNDSKGNKES